MFEFAVGDKVVYPLHGAGVIEAIEEREVLGERHRYYVMRLPARGMTVLIPTEAAGQAGLRPVVDGDAAERVLALLRTARPPEVSSWNQRYRDNAERLRGGDILEVASVVRDLSARERAKGLSTGERRMLDSARQILVSELALAMDLPEAEVGALLQRLLADPS